MAKTEETRNRTVIIDLTAKTIISFSQGEDFFKEIDWQFGKYRGDKFQLAIETVAGTVEKMRIAGSDNQFQEVFRPDRDQATYEILETWQWTGRRWKQVW